MTFPEYPVYFTDGRCVHCGAPNALKPMNIFNKPTSVVFATSSISYLKCAKCGTEFFIRWTGEDGDKFNKPVIESLNSIPRFTSIVEKSLNDQIKLDT